MKIQTHEHGFPFIVVDDYFNDEEMEILWNEVDNLYKEDIFLDPVDSYSAFDANGFLKMNKCIHLDEYFAKKREKCEILRLNRKIFTEEVLQQGKSWFFTNFIKTCDYDATLLSYYESDNYYRAHTDASTVTGLFWFFKEPKKFEGGQFIFPDYKLDIEVVSNRMILFPSFIRHQVLEVRLDPKYSGQNMGRWCMTHFLDSKTMADMAENKKRRDVEKQNQIKKDVKNVMFNR
jgi:hypothetical protein|tara:strand:+ start:261 stop:959 length:699 start_codon:yes stop_codon:yes gene_type:complete